MLKAIENIAPQVSQLVPEKESLKSEKIDKDTKKFIRNFKSYGLTSKASQSTADKRMKKMHKCQLDCEYEQNFMCQ